jgi:hypothetical protein
MEHGFLTQILQDGKGLLYNMFHKFAKDNEQASILHIGHYDLVRLVCPPGTDPTMSFHERLKDCQIQAQRHGYGFHRQSHEE